MSLRKGSSSASADAVHELVSITSDNGVKKRILKEGDGDVIPIKKGETVAIVHYVGRLLDGTKFDSSYDRHKPLEFKINTGMVILGWDRGVSTMKKGEVCELVCVPDYAYGNRGIGPIPPNSTLVFEVELLGWKQQKSTDDVLNILIFVAVIVVAALGTYLYLKN